MNFNNIVQQQFERAGWKAGRDVSIKYDTDFLEKAPEFLKEFLKEYGNLIIKDAKSYHSNVTNKLLCQPDYSGILSDDEDDYNYWERNLSICILCT